MLTNTFIHIQGIGAKTEQRLWNSGIRDWDSLSGDLRTTAPAGRKFFLEKGIEESQRHLANFNPAYFSKLLPSNQGWRMFPDFRNSTVYLDIDGFFAVLLWEEYQQTVNHKVLDTLLAYNIQDTINLENLMVIAYNLKLRDTPFYKSHYIQESTPPSNPFRADLTTVDRLKNSSQYWSSQQWY